MFIEGMGHMLSILGILGFVIKLLFWLVVIFAFVHALVTHFVLLLELRLLNLSTSAAEEGVSIPWGPLAKSFVIEFLCNCLSYVLYPFRALSFSSKVPSTAISAPPILFIHGYLHHQMAWLWCIRALRKKEGVGPLYSIDFTSPLEPIPVLAAQLQTKIRDILAETGSEKIILVGHSMGGLISSYYCEYLAPPNEVDRVITLGSPFQGTWLSALVMGPNAQELSPNSVFLRELGERIERSQVPYYSIATKLDNMVVPWESAIPIPEGISKESLILEDSGHLRLLISPLVIEKIAQWVKG